MERTWIFQHVSISIWMGRFWSKFQYQSLCKVGGRLMNYNQMFLLNNLTYTKTWCSVHGPNASHSLIFIGMCSGLGIGLHPKLMNLLLYQSCPHITSYPCTNHLTILYLQVILLPTIAVGIKCWTCPILHCSPLALLLWRLPVAFLLWKLPFYTELT